MESEPRIDSEAIFIIGPFVGARMIFDCSIFGVEPPRRDGKWQNTENFIRDDAGKEIGRKPFELFAYAAKGQGYALKSYHPQNERLMKQFMEVSFEPLCTLDQAAVADFRQKSRTKKDLFPFPVTADLGEETWKWPKMPGSKQKLVDPSIYDPTGELFTGGAHMPLLIFLGDASQTRRTPQARKQRAEKANARGWGPQRWRVAVDGGVAYVREYRGEASVPSRPWRNIDGTRGGGEEQDNTRRRGNDNDADNTRGGGAGHSWARSSWDSEGRWDGRHHWHQTWDSSERSWDRSNRSSARRLIGAAAEFLGQLGDSWDSEPRRTSWASWDGWRNA